MQAAPRCNFAASEAQSIGIDDLSRLHLGGDRLCLAG
jgi:hypothetical protein